MMLYIDWNPSAELCQIGSFAIRWYALCWIFGLLAAYFIVRRLFKNEYIDPAPSKKGALESTGKFDPLVFYCFVGVVLGARLGHCLFYEPDYYLSSWTHVVEMLLPMKHDPATGWHMAGYSGLASHGGTLGLFLALLLYVRRTKVALWRVLDMIALAAPLTSFFIRMGNLMNSEIIGRPTDLPWGFIFHTNEALVDGHLAPRHPAQLYEAIAYLLIFIFGWWIYRQSLVHNTGQQLRTASSEAYASNSKIGTGFYFGYCLATIFIFRFFIEYLKEVQGGTDDGSTALDMGQLLSIPFALAGLWCMFRLPGVKRAAKVDKTI